MIVNEAIGAVRVRCNVQTDDSTIPNRFVFASIKDVRSELLRQESNKDQLWNGGSAQYIPGIVLRRSTISEAKEFSANVVIYKSVSPIPKLIDTKYGKIILGVYFDNGARLQAIEYADWIGTFKRRHKLPTSGSFFLRNEHLYVVDYKSESEEIILNMEGIFEDPEQVDSVACGDCTYIGDREFSMPGYLARRILDMAAEIVKRKYNIPADIRNNGKEDIQSTTQS